MTIENPAMGEQPIFTCKAHVFHIDPKTKRSWLPASSSSVSVSFFYDSSRNLHRIISVEGTKAVINSTIIPNMTFTKTSQKFGQWSDVRANTVYGLGFGTEAELNKFIEKFQEIREAARLSGAGVTSSSAATAAATPTASAAGTNGCSAVGAVSPGMARAGKPTDQGDCSPLPPPPATSSSALLGSDQTALHQRSQSLSAGQSADSPKHEARPSPSTLGDKAATAVVTSSPSASMTSSAGVAATNSSEAQLKYENDRLKLALAQSSANARKWEVELSTLKTNNARLTAALQESTANVEEWKLQLQSYKEENAKMRSRLFDLESGRGGGPEVTTGRGQADDRVKSLELELEQVRSQLTRSQSQLEISLSAQDSQHKVLDTLQVQLADKLLELRTIHGELRQAIQS